MEEKLVASATAHARSAMRCTQEKAGTRLKHAPPALRTGAGTSRAGFEKKVPARGLVRAGVPLVLTPQRDEDLSNLQNDFKILQTDFK